MIVLAGGLVARWASRPGPETPLERAYRICDDCGIDRPGVDALINAVHHAELTRAQKLALFREQFAREEDARLCEPCAVAVLDAGND